MAGLLSTSYLRPDCAAVFVGVAKGCYDVFSAAARARKGSGRSGARPKPSSAEAVLLAVGLRASYLSCTACTERWSTSICIALRIAAGEVCLREGATTHQGCALPLSTHTRRRSEAQQVGQCLKSYPRYPAGLLHSPLIFYKRDVELA